MLSLIHSNRIRDLVDLIRNTLNQEEDNTLYVPAALAKAIAGPLDALKKKVCARGGRGGCLLCMQLPLLSHACRWPAHAVAASEGISHTLQHSRMCCNTHNHIPQFPPMPTRNYMSTADWVDEISTGKVVPEGECAPGCWRGGEQLPAAAAIRV